MCQGVSLSRSLGLPTDGEGPWERSVDVAQNAVDWKAVSSKVRKHSCDGQARENITD